MIAVELKGRLGNQLFQYAVCKAIAIRNNYEYSIPENFLPNTQLHLNCDLGTKRGKLGGYFLQNSEYLQDILDTPDNTLLSGFFQSEQYFKDIEDVIRNDFKLPYSEEAEKLLLKYDISEYCYVHLRGTDYREIDYALPKRYWANAKNLILEKNKNIKFLIITDDIEYSKAMFGNDAEFISNDIFLDFYMLSNAKYLILANSSFSWWATYLNNNVEVAIGPNRWYNYKYLTRFKPHNFVPEGIELEKITYID